MRVRVVWIPLVVAACVAAAGSTPRSARLEAAGSPRAAGPERAATQLEGISALEGPEGVTVTLHGNGRLEPLRVEAVRTPPHRVLIDLANVESRVPAITTVEKDPIQRIRVAANSVNPLVTRVVLDLTRRASYRVDAEGATRGELKVTMMAREGAPVPPADPPATDAPIEAPSPGPAQAVNAAGPTTVEAVAPASEHGPAISTDAALAAATSLDAAAPTAPAAVNPAPQAPAPAAPQPAEPQTGVNLSRGEARKQFTGHPVSLDFQGVDLRAVLRTFAEITGLNLVIDPGVQGTVDVSLREVPWDQALDIILRANQLGYSVDGTIVRIAPLSALSAEEKERRKLADEQALSGELRVLTHRVSYAKAAELAALVTRSALSQRGTVQVDERTNTLIISDLQVRLDTATDLINTLDRPQPQVEIEARIVQTTREFARAIGVQWGFNGRMAPELGNTSGLAFPNRGVIGGRTGREQGPDDPAANPFESTSTAVNLRAPNATSAAGLFLGAINGSFNLDVALTALERNGKGRVLSTPRVSTQNNVAAEVMQGIQIPIQTVANNTVTVTFKDAALSLRVTPQITASQTVIMRIDLENASPDFSREVNGIPPIDTQRATTQVLVSDGDTTVIGGIFVSREQSVNDRTPVLYKIPLLGWLFKRDSVNDESRELLIFITPRISKS